MICDYARLRFLCIFRESDLIFNRQAQPADDLPMYLGRQSTVLRRKDSSKNIMEELRFRRKSLKRSGVGDHRK
ncbi:hypothetical protein P5673_028376 [Acropora cervicornis]|uniref:Uncharacterized protein n=1 Tax=Acropora cervicornis TaxID=6130 RepID=A0AAD9UUW4_ACRCE|nr:hypothetical protein P5673_028376 [Acropora cervicornis]